MGRTPACSTILRTCGNPPSDALIHPGLVLSPHGRLVCSERLGSCLISLLRTEHSTTKPKPNWLTIRAGFKIQMHIQCFHVRMVSVISDTA